MKVQSRILSCFLPVLVLIAGCSQSTPSFSDATLASDEEVVVSLKKIDYHFKRARNFADTYMVFGGGVSQADVIGKVSISGIDLEKAMSFYEKYPDFYRCNSPGAGPAQRAVIHLDIIPADSNVQKTLKNALSQFEKNLGNNGDRIFVKLEGEVLKMTSAIVREDGYDIKDRLPSQMRHDYYLVKSAEIAEAKVLLKDT